ncbi:hypothetical protein BDZ91DRAFT_417934 [Kalaharituber pfeilii]|nr:hypothetical protein BDZ91DRAFT_417934 [Kalaharituber pfeilii]
MTTSSTTPTPAQAAGTPEIHLEASPDIGTTDANHVEKQQQVEESPTTSTMDKQQEGTNTEMLSPPGSPTPTPITTIALTTPANSNSLPSPSPSQVFAPRPIRAPFPVLYRPIPQRLPKHVFQLDESPIARSPSPALTQVVPHRRSSSAASSISSVGDLSARWNAMSMKVVESKTEAEEDKENATTGSLAASSDCTVLQRMSSMNSTRSSATTSPTPSATLENCPPPLLHHCTALVHQQRLRPRRLTIENFQAR